MTFRAQTKVEKEVLKEECAACVARPGAWCVGIRGQFKGATKSYLHGVRFDAALYKHRITLVDGTYKVASEVPGFNVNDHTRRKYS